MQAAVQIHDQAYRFTVPKEGKTIKGLLSGCEIEVKVGPIPDVIDGTCVLVKEELLAN